MKVKVTKQDIEDGTPNFNDVCGCPIWLALYRALGLQYGTDEANFKVVRVSEARLGRICFTLPAKAIEFQDRGIAGKPVKPFTFETKPRVNSRVHP